MNPELTVKNLINEFSIIKGANIIKPRAEYEVYPALHEDTPSSPRLTRMCARKLVLWPGLLTPVHCHPHGKEKVYVWQRGEAIVFIFVENKWWRLPLSYSNPSVAVPPGTPHALFCYCEIKVMVEILVITFNDDPSDIEWEEAYVGQPLPILQRADWLRRELQKKSDETRELYKRLRSIEDECPHTQTKMVHVDDGFGMKERRFCEECRGYP